MKKTKKKILIAFGTRPEALKLIPLIRALKRSPDFDCFVCLTGQHREMLDQVTSLFNIHADADLRLMRPNQTLAYLSGNVMSRFGKILHLTRPDVVFVQGDTATALMVGIACFYARVPIAHLEAGLRTWNKLQPFPEEINRTLLSHLADYHFTPTAEATRNLLGEGILKKDIYQVGNTIVDTVRIASPIVRKRYPIFDGIDLKKRLLFVTAHRRESFGSDLEQIFLGIRQIVRQFPDVAVVYPVHMNPNVMEPAYRILGNQERIHLLRPMTYEEVFWIMRRCYAIMTDSGGIQEEAPCFRKPVLVLRNLTERREGIRAGVAKLVGTNAKKIFRETQKLLTSTTVYRRMKARRNPYGDGNATARIMRVLAGSPMGKPFRSAG